VWWASAFTCFIVGLKGVKVFMPRNGVFHFLEEGDNTELFFHM
jgi:hypothetical protein